MLQNANLDTIDPTLLTAVTGGGPSLGDRSDPKAPPLTRSAPQPSPESTWGGIDADMVKKPPNPGMDLGGSMHPLGIGTGGRPIGGINI